MIISGSSMENALAVMTSNKSMIQMRTQKSVGSMRGQTSQQKVRTVAFNRMMKNTSIDGTGMLVDIYA
jgi:hypothetical protein